MVSEREKVGLKDYYHAPFASDMRYPVVVLRELISIRLRLLARFLGSWKRIRINYDLIPSKTSIFLGWCNIHKLYYLDYEHGWKKEIFCPSCCKEATNKSHQPSK